MTRLNLATYSKFQFTHPGRGATGNSVAIARLFTVSIHAPREGCDLSYYTTYV